MNDTDFQRYLDEKAIVDVTIRYTWAIDTKDWAALDQVFVPDATGEMSAAGQRSRDEIVARIRGALEPLDDSQHIVSNHQVTIDGDTATCRCYLHSQHVRAGAGAEPTYVIGARYEDQLVRTPAGWRIKHRKLVKMWTSGNREVVHPSG